MLLRKRKGIAMDKVESRARIARPDRTVVVAGAQQARSTSGQDHDGQIAKERASRSNLSVAAARATSQPPSAFPARQPWSIASGQGALSLDRAFKAQLARLTFGLSPTVLVECPLAGKMGITSSVSLFAVMV